MSISVRILLISLSGDDLVPTVSCVIRSVFNDRIRKERCRVLTLAMVDDTACNYAYYIISGKKNKSQQRQNDYALFWFAVKCRRS